MESYRKSCAIKGARLGSNKFRGLGPIRGGEGESWQMSGEGGEIEEMRWEGLSGERRCGEACNDGSGKGSGG